MSKRDWSAAAAVIGSLFFVTSAATAQVPINAQAATLLRASLSALTGGNPISDVRLEGSARLTAGSDEETGTAILEARSAASRVSLSLTNGQLLEVRKDTTGFWSGADGITHPMPLHNTWTSGNWFVPALIIQEALNVRNFSAALVNTGSEATAAETIHLTRIEGGLPADRATEIQRLSATDLLLDSKSLLPISISFTIHPDTEPNVDVPVRIEFSDYRTISGRKAPFRIKKLLYGDLFLDLTISNASFDTALPDSEFNGQ